MKGMKHIRRCADSGAYQFSMDVPADLRELVGKKVVKRSLEGRDEEQAARLAADYAAECEEIFQRIRGGMNEAMDPGVFGYLLYKLMDRV